MAVQGIRGVVEAAIQRAAQATGMDFGFLMKTARRESSLDPRARAASSSAAGLFQFVDQTWLSTLKQHGAKHGLGQYADLIGRGADGRYHVEGRDARRAVMDLKLDPHAASLMAGELASDHAAYLKGRTGRTPTTGELYAAHFLGPQGSARLIEAAQARPDVSAAALFPDAARANRAIFFRQGRAASVAEVYANLTRSGGDDPVPSTDRSLPMGGYLQYVSSGHADRQRDQDALVAMILGEDSGAAGVGSNGRLASSLFTSEMLKVLSDSRET